MTIFIITTASGNSEKLGNNIADQFPMDFLRLTEDQWLVSADTSATELCSILGIIPDGPFRSTLVFAISSYYGMHSTETWDWIKRKWEGGPHGPRT